MSEFLIIGEALVDIVERPGQEPQEFPGGSPMNVAIGLARLDNDVELLTWFGADERGTSVLEHLQESGVKLAPGSTSAARTSTARAQINADGVASYEFDLEWKLPESTVAPDVRSVHTGSIAAVLKPGGEQVLDIVRAAHGQATVSYDPNLRPALMGTPDETRPIVEAIIDISDVVKVSDEDLEWLHPGVNPRQVAHEWLTRGPSVVVVTLGGEGAFAVTRAHETEIPAPRVTVADTVGAGDSFMGGLLDGLGRAGLLGADKRAALRDISAEALDAVLREAIQIAAITVSRAGANPPTRAELKG
jgi:fructokinase